ncbi:MAG: hypothetical protein U0R23_12265 [Candidatus Nanopelagicales bacterium]
MKAAWGDVEKELMQRVFYAHNADTVATVDDLAQEGILDSLSIVAILEVLVEMSGNEDALTAATASDFHSLASIRTFYQTL